MSNLMRLSQSAILAPLTRNIAGYMFNRRMMKIAEHFSAFIYPTVVKSVDDENAAFNIRHQVYCDELGWEEKRDDEREFDRFDEYSTHCLMKHRATGEPMGTIRVINPSTDSELLPIEEFCLDFIDEGNVTPKDFKRSQICELSRLSIPKNFRRRAMDKHKGSATGAINMRNYSETEMRCFPFIAIGLYLSAASIVEKKGIKHIFVMMEPRLARSLKFVGVGFNQIGAVTEYHGQRAPYYIPADCLKSQLRPGLFKMFSKISLLISQQMPGEQ